MERRNFLTFATVSMGVLLSAFPSIAEVRAKRVRITKDRVSSKKRSYSYKMVADPTGAAPTKRVERFELRGGDCSNEGDCTPRPLNGRPVSRARTERVLFTDMKNGEEGLFSYFIYFPSNEYTVVKEFGNAFGQLLATLSRSWDSDSMPIFSLDTDEGSRPNLLAAMKEAAAYEGRRPNEKSINFGKLVRGSPWFDKWIKIEAYFGLSEGEDGYIDFRVNNNSMGRFIGRTILPGGGFEVRYGIYQSGTNQFPGGANAIPPQVVYFSDVRILQIIR